MQMLNRDPRKKIPQTGIRTRGSDIYPVLQLFRRLLLRLHYISIQQTYQGDVKQLSIHWLGAAFIAVVVASTHIRIMRYPLGDPDPMDCSVRFGFGALELLCVPPLRPFVLMAAYASSLNDEYKYIYTYRRALKSEVLLHNSPFQICCPPFPLPLSPPPHGSMGLL